MTDYLVIYERTEDGGWSAHTPTFPAATRRARPARRSSG